MTTVTMMNPDFEMVYGIGGIHHAAVSNVPRIFPTERLVLHATRLPARNTVENLERLFCNMGVILTAYENEPGFNMSFEGLFACAAIQPDLARALWVLLETEDVGIAIDAVRKIGADFIVLPYAKTQQDYLEEVAALLSDRLVPDLGTIVH